MVKVIFNISLNPKVATQITYPVLSSFFSQTFPANHDVKIIQMKKYFEAKNISYEKQVECSSEVEQRQKKFKTFISANISVEFNLGNEHVLFIET